MAKRKTLGDIILLDKKGLAEVLITSRETKWHRCNICGDPYIEEELIDDEDIGYICEVCARSKKELDDEQEEMAVMIREEKKSKALP